MTYLCIEICKCSTYLTKCKSPCVTSPKPYDQLAGMLCYMACHHDHISDHGTQTAAPYLMLCLCPTAAYRLLAYHAEYVVGDYGKFQHQLVGVEFIGRQPFQIHVYFDFAVELFTFSMCMVQANDVMTVHSQVCPPGVGFDVIHKQELVVLVDCSVNDLISCTDGDGLFLSVLCFVSDGFSVTS